MEAPGEVSAGEDEEGDGGNEEAAEEGEVADGLEFLVARRGDGGGDALDGGEVALEGGTDEREAGEVLGDAGEGKAGLVAVGDGGGGDDIEGMDSGIDGPAEGEGGEGADEGGEIGEGMAGTGSGADRRGEGGHMKILLMGACAGPVASGTRRLGPRNGATLAGATRVAVHERGRCAGCQSPCRQVVDQPAHRQTGRRMLCAAS